MTLTAFFLNDALAQSEIPLRGGILEINASCDDGESGGQIDLTLAYADRAKTLVRLTGSVRSSRGSGSIQQTVPLTELKKIFLYAQGGAGWRGEDGEAGFHGFDGSAGWEGSPGCPPQAGSNGTNGTDGGNGRDGRDGGDGGRGGSILVEAAPDQSELLLLVSMQAEGGAAGEAGRGGEGGRAGRGGAGGLGGVNTCDPKGSDAPNGLPGFDGRAGQDGRSGRSGDPGRKGSAEFLVGGDIYSAAFAIGIEGTVSDEIDDGVLQPGEKLSLTHIKLTNTGAMPTPEGQAITVLLAPNDTLTPVRIEPIVLRESLAPGESVTLRFRNGELSLKVPYDSRLIGRRVVMATRLQINNLGVAGESLDTKYVLTWPLVAKASLAKVDGLFEGSNALSYTLKNVSRKAIGPQGIQPFAIELKWESTNVPGSAVTVQWPDGRRFKLSEPVLVDDITIEAGKTLALPLQLVIFNTRSVKVGDGTLKFGLRLMDLSTGRQEVVQNADTYLRLKMDLFNLEFNRTADVSSQGITCVFKNRSGAVLPVKSIAMSKAKTAPKVQVTVSIKSGSTIETSPTLGVQSHIFFPYYQNFQGDNAKAVTVQLLNRELAPLSGKHRTWTFAGCR